MHQSDIDTFGFVPVLLLRLGADGRMDYGNAHRRFVHEDDCWRSAANQRRRGLINPAYRRRARNAQISQFSAYSGAGGPARRAAGAGTFLCSAEEEKKPVSDEPAGFPPFSLSRMEPESDRLDEPRRRRRT